MLPIRSFATSLLVFASLATAVAGNLDVNQNGQTFDYVIVGGGLSGLVAANRLSENPRVSVLVVEYGTVDRSNRSLVPYYATTLNTANTFRISTAPEPYLGNVSYAITVGAVAGGGSTVNGMLFGRASAADYDSWEHLGNKGWGWAGLLPYFKKATTFTPPTPSVAKALKYTWDASYWGHRGLQQASYPDFQYPDIYKTFAGFEELGVPYQKDHAGGNATGVFWAPSSLDPKTRTRSSSLTAYYDSASERRNLKLLTEHKVTQILFSAGVTASGVKVLDRATNKTFTIKARKEVILAAGAIHTPHLLQLSGIGPKAVLKAAGIKAKVDLASVGSNFQDHPVAYLRFTVNQSFPNAGTLSTNATFNALALQEYLEHRSGPYTRAQGNCLALLPLHTVAGTAAAKSLVANLTAQPAGSHLPSIYTADKTLLKGFQAQRALLAAQFRAGSVAAVEMPFSGAGATLNAIQKPLSRGTVHLNASDPAGAPVVTTNALQNPFDRAVLASAVEYVRALFKTAALSVLDPVENAPGPDVHAEALVDALISSGMVTPTFAHPSGSCPMMPRQIGGCVGADLRVYGTKRLSVIDASILPIIPANHLQATMYAVAEKAADLIKARA